mmetsp:Transcript_44653/g.104294  ORF Transcript_44653/g.104294 Transcript_44653/m.104294 type:complete len:216 (+) Transcript_44653:49-696(+)
MQNLTAAVTAQCATDNRSSLRAQFSATCSRLARRSHLARTTAKIRRIAPICCVRVAICAAHESLRASRQNPSQKERAQMASRASRWDCARRRRSKARREARKRVQPSSSCIRTASVLPMSSTLASISDSVAPSNPSTATLPRLVVAGSAPSQGTATFTYTPSSEFEPGVTCSGHAVAANLVASSTGGSRSEQACAYEHRQSSPSGSVGERARPSS